MFKSLSITPCEDITVRELLRLKEDGHSVYRTSHAGNWSIYKLLMSEIGLPDCIWDVTCINRDINNQPRYQLINGKKVDLLREIIPFPRDNTKLLTPYYRPKDNPDITLSNFHVAPLKKMYGDLITSQSESLLDFKDNISLVFDIAQKYIPSQLSRYILSCGCMVHLNSRYFDSPKEMYDAKCSHGNNAEIPRNLLATSAVETLEELKRLVFDPVGYVPKGGVLYSFELVVVSYYLWCYWKFGDKVIYELSGPDMMGYATKNDFIKRVENVLKVVCEHLPEYLYPQNIEAKIVPATVFRFGYPSNCFVSKSVMAAHETIRRIQPLKREFKDIEEIFNSLNDTLSVAVKTIEKNADKWDLFHNPAKDAFYSQHDLFASNDKMTIQNLFMDMSLKDMGIILQNLSQIEKSLIKNLV